MSPAHDLLPRTAILVTAGDTTTASPPATAISESRTPTSAVGREGPDDPFWNAPFGAATPLTELGDETGVAAYFDRGRTLLRSAVRGG